MSTISSKDLGNILIAGVGPAAIQTAVQLYNAGFSKKIGLYNRPGAHAERIKRELNQNHFEVSLTIQGKEAKLTAKMDCFFDDVSHLSDEWDTIVLATPCTSYANAIESLQAAELKRVRTIILLAPNIGSNDLVKNLLLKETVEVISISTYFAATKSHKSATKAHTKAFKKRIYLGSSNRKSRMVDILKEFLKSLNIEGEIVEHPLDAECRNITTYVHPAFFLNRFTLNEIFGLHPNCKKYMYKFYPEGPITPQRIKTMVRLWKEISALMNELGAKSINLLQFLNDDNYPVPPESIQREDIDNFSEYEEVKQEYLLYIRYASILIDPFSIPDHEGRYFEFSAVPFKKAEEENEGVWSVPRIPFEDYQKLIVIYGLAENSGIPMPEMKRLIKNFESGCKEIESLLGIKESLIGARRESSLREVTNIMKERKRRLQ